MFLVDVPQALLGFWGSKFPSPYSDCLMSVFNTPALDCSWVLVMVSAESCWTPAWQGFVLRAGLCLKSFTPRLRSVTLLCSREAGASQGHRGLQGDGAPLLEEIGIVQPGGGQALE